MRMDRNTKPGITPFQMLVTYYFFSIAVSFGLLLLPWVLQPGVEVPLIDTLFTAVSAVSVTGLTVFDISQTYSGFGMAMLLLIMQFGAIGIMSLGTFIWLLVGKKIGMRERELIMIDHNQTSIAGVVQLIKEIAKILFTIEAFGALVLTVHFKRYFETWEEAAVHGIFTSVSATTNGGFDITGMSLQPYHLDYFCLLYTSPSPRD